MRRNNIFYDATYLDQLYLRWCPVSWRDEVINSIKIDLL